MIKLTNSLVKENCTAADFCITIIRVGLCFIQNKGIMTEALRCVIDFGFNELKLDKIEGCTDHKNESSKKILEKTGFHLMENRKDQNNDSNSIYELLKSQR